jgi:hypothetical protein
MIFDPWWLYRIFILCVLPLLLAACEGMPCGMPNAPC